MKMWVLNLRTMGCYRMRNLGPGEMFRGFVSCDMMYREGLVSSYLVSISLPSPNLTFEDLWHGETGTPDTGHGWPRASPVSPIMCSVSLLNVRYHHHPQTRVAMTCVKTHAASVWINPQVSDICRAEQESWRKWNYRSSPKYALIQTPIMSN